MTDDKKTDEHGASETIKSQLRKAFDDKAAEDLPADLVSLIGRLREQDDANEK